MSGDEPFEAAYAIEDFFSYSYGGISRFFREVVENEQLYGTECPDCGTVWCPPRSYCSECLVETEWTPLDGTGTVMAAIPTYYVPRTHNSLKYFDLPYVLALVKLDGADTSLYTMVVGTEDDEISRGTTVEVVFRAEREGYVTDFYFRPVLDDR